MERNSCFSIKLQVNDGTLLICWFDLLVKGQSQFEFKQLITSKLLGIGSKIKRYAIKCLFDSGAIFQTLPTATIISSVVSSTTGRASNRT